ncbi:MAG: NUDIX domain-containing protein, partial [Betaproteobacteria bacterium]
MNTPLEVAAAVVQQEDGTFLLAERPVGKPYAGWWEFPGGKIEACETPYHALVRELHEEL